MNLKFWTWTWNGTVQKVLPSRKEVLDDFIQDRVKEIMFGNFSGSPLTNKEAGYVAIEINAAVKEKIEERRITLSRDLEDTIEVLRLM